MTKQFKDAEGLVPLGGFSSKNVSVIERFSAITLLGK